MARPTGSGDDSEKFEEPDFTQEGIDIADRALDAAARGEFADVDYSAVGADASDEQD